MSKPNRPPHDLGDRSASRHVQEPEYVEVVDRANRFLALFSAGLATEHHLYHRAVALLIFSRCGKLLLQKKRAPAGKHFYWGVPHTRHMHFREAQQDRAGRLFISVMGTSAPRLYKKNTKLLPGEHGPTFLTIYSTGKTVPVLLHRSLLPVDAEEMGELVLEFPDLIEPLTASLWQDRNLLIKH